MNGSGLPSALKSCGSGGCSLRNQPQHSSVLQHTTDRSELRFVFPSIQTVKLSALRGRRLSPSPLGSLRRWLVAASAGVWVFQALHLAPLLLWVAERAYGHTASPGVLHKGTGQRLLVTQK